MITGTLSKMKTALSEPVTYQLVVGDALVHMNPYIGQHLEFRHTGNIYCGACGRKTSKSFGEGYCFPCFRDLPECDMCIVKPELCHFAAGTCRDSEWGLANCMQPHFVYLANSSGVKVGITRAHQLPTRWIDQGAVQGLPIFRVQTRLQSGMLEVVLANHVADKTDWRKMLKEEATPRDLPALRDELMSTCADEISRLIHLVGAGAIQALPDAQITDIRYPVVAHAQKLTSFNLDKSPQVSGRLTGIKGQYLIFENGVINVRKYSSYEIEIDATPVL